MSNYSIAGTIADRIIVRLAYMQRWPLIGRLVGLMIRLRGTDLHPESLHPSGDLHLPHAGIGVVLHPNVRLGRRVTIFHGVTVGRSDVWRPIDGDASCRIGDDVVLGAGAAVLFGADGLVIGDGAVIGANSVVTTDVPARELWAGCPARKVGSR